MILKINLILQKHIKGPPETRIQEYAKLKKIDLNDDERGLYYHNLIKDGESFRLASENSYEIFSEKSGIK
jgi:hypothetical protein